MTTAAQAPIADLAPENGPLREYLNQGMASGRAFRVSTITWSPRSLPRDQITLQKKSRSESRFLGEDSQVPFTLSSSCKSRIVRMASESSCTSSPFRIEIWKEVNSPQSFLTDVAGSTLLFE